MEAFVKTDVAQGIGTITFFHPAQNSLPGTVLAELRDAILSADQNPDIRVIILQSGGDRTFCAGASFTELASIEDEARGKEFFMGFANVINAIRTISKIVIGRVQGKAVGGGVGLASAVDFCIATKFASIRLSELAVGIGPFVIGPAVSRKVGLSAFSQMALDAEVWQTAQWAREKGLYAEVYEDIASMDQAIAALSSRLVGSNPAALTQLKRVFWEGTDHWDTLLEERAMMSGSLVLSDFSKSAIAKFLQTA